MPSVQQRPLSCPACVCSAFHVRAPLLRMDALAGPGRSLFRRFRSHLAVACALQPRLRPAFRPGVSLFRRFRSHLAVAPAPQPRLRPAATSGCVCALMNRQSVEQYGSVERWGDVEHRRAHGADSVRTRSLGAHGKSFPPFPCAREPFLRTGSPPCARDEVKV